MTVMRQSEDLVLVPGFEPGSTDRESDMMDRTTPHERQSMKGDLFSKGCILETSKISLSLSLSPLFLS